MGDETQQRIDRALKRGFSKEQIADSYAKKLSENGISQERINAFLARHDLVPAISQQTFAKQLSESMTGFGRDVSSGLAAAKTVAKGGGGAAAQLLSLPMAYAGGSAGAGAEDLIRGVDRGSFVDELKYYHGQGMKGAKDELMGGPVADLFTRGAKPFARKADPAMAQYGRERGLPLPASSIAPTKTAKTFEWIGDIFTGGKLVGDMRRNQLSRKFENLLDYTTSDFMSLTDRGTAGDVLADAIKDAKKGLRQKSMFAYKGFKKEVIDELGTTPLDMTRFIQTAEKYRQQMPQGSDIRQFLAEIGDRGQRSNYEMTFDEFDMFRKQIWTMTRKKHPHIGGELWNAVEADLRSNGDKLWPALKAAKDASILEKTFASNKAVQAIGKRYALGNSEQIILQAFRTGNFKAVNQIKNAVSKQAWDTASERFVRNIIETAWNPATQEFKPAKFINLYTQYRRQIKNVMPGIADNLDMLTEAMSKSIDDIGKVGGSPESAIARAGVSAAAGGGSALSSLLTGSPLEIAMLMPEGFSIVLANAVRAPRGMFKKWLTTGLKPRGTAQMLRLGNRFVDFDVQDLIEDSD